MTSAALAIELCGLCPIEPACKRRQMLEHFGGAAPSDRDAASPTVKGEPYRCWLLSALGRAKKSG